MDTDNVQILLGCLAGVALILFLVAAIMSYRSWKWHTLLLVFMNFFAVIAFFIFAVQTLSAHKHWREHARDIQEKIAIETQAIEELKEGVVEDDELAKKGIRQLEVQLRDLMPDRGMVWDNCQPDNVNASGRVRIAIQRDTPHQIREEMIVYVMEESRIEGDTPGTYLGEFIVTNVTGNVNEEDLEDEEEPAEEESDAEESDAEDSDEEAPAEGEEAAEGKDPVEEEPADEEAEEEEPEEEEPEEEPAPSDGPLPESIVTLEPNWKMSDFELNRLRNSRGTWTVYAKMPVDNHYSLTDFTDDELYPTRDDGKPDRGQDKLDRDGRIAQLVPARVLAEYQKDGTEPTEDDPLERRLIYVRFLKEHSVAAPVDRSPERRKGDARDKKTVFEKGDKYWLYRASVTDAEGNEFLGADQLIEQGIAKQVPDFKERYERELRDYALQFHRMYLNRRKAADEIALIGWDTDQINLRIVAAKGVIARVTATRNQLASDGANYQREVQSITAHLQALEAQFATRIKDLRRLFVANQKMAARIKKIQLSVAADINQSRPAPGNPSFLEANQP